MSPITTGQPVKNPVDAAVEAVRAAWEQPGLRRELLDALADVESFNDLSKERMAVATQSAIAQQLNDLEAQRLELLRDIEQLKRGGQQVRDQLKQEIRRDEAAALAEAVAQTQAAQAQQKRCEEEAADALRAAKDARAALDQLVGDELEAKIRDVALTQRVQERLRLLSGDAAPLPPTPEKLGISALIDRLLGRAKAKGITWTREEAANLCVCLALSPVLMLSGAPGSGKTTVARLLAESLGVVECGRAPVCPPAPPRGKDPAAPLRDTPDIPAALLLEDANLAPQRDVFRGYAQTLPAEWRVIATLQDAHSGQPLSANALDQGFFLRLCAPATLPWQPATPAALPPESLISIEAIRRSLPRAEVPAALVARMDALRGTLADCGAELSRRALDDAWRYCSSMLALLDGQADPDRLFDRVVAQRLLPATLASAPIAAVMRLRDAVADLPLSAALLRQPLPVEL